MKKILIFLLILVSISGYAAQDVYHFASDDEARRFDQLTAQLRCLVCQNQTLAESNAPLANDLRNQIFDKISHGQTDLEIIDYLVSRYGNFILYNPPLNSETWLLWFAPVLVLLAGLSYLIYYLRKNQERGNAITS
jgi:cytochrome c-type biogenesis protein CcmH